MRGPIRAGHSCRKPDKDGRLQAIGLAAFRVDGAVSLPNQPRSVSRICLCNLTGSARIFLRMRMLSISTATENAIAK